jgi:hypothetical protein
VSINLGLLVYVGVENKSDGNKQARAAGSLASKINSLARVDNIIKRVLVDLWRFSAYGGILGRDERKTKVVCPKILGNVSCARAFSSLGENQAK